MLNREKLYSEAARLRLTKHEVKQLYRQVPKPSKPPPAFPPTDFVHAGDINARVDGASRFKFFDLPRVGRRGDSYVQAPVHFVAPQPGGEKEVHEAVKKMKKKRSKKRKKPVTAHENLDVLHFHDVDNLNARTISTQTDYRESEAQTDPYTHEKIIIPKGEQPEALQLQHLNAKNGLQPVTKKTFGEIDRIRRRRNIEANLPMGRDKASFEKRCQYLKKLELLEWNEKEGKIKDEQVQKMRKLEKQIRRGHMEEQERNQLRVDELRRQIMEDMERKVSKVQLKRGKALNKTLKKYATPMKGPIKPLLKKKVGMAKKKYIPGTHLGTPHRILTVGRGGERMDIKPQLLSDVKALEKIEKKNKVHEDYFQRKGVLMQKHKKKERKLKSTMRKEMNIQKDIEFAKTFSLNLSKIKNKQRGNLLDLYRKTPRIYRPPTPVLEYSDSGDELENAVVLIQKLLRGRTIQNKFSFAKEKALELIKELQMVEKVIRRERKLAMSEEHIQQEEHKRKQQQMEYLVDNIQGELVARSLDYLSKELIRQEEISKIEVLKAKADLERRKREGHETERREEEVKKMKEMEKKYNQVIRTHTTTVDTYIDDIFENAVERCSYKSALKTVQSELMKKKEMVEKEREKELKEKNNSTETDKMEIKDLLRGFLLPQVKRDLLKKKVNNEQKRFVKAVHDSINEDEFLQNVFFPKKSS